MTDPLDSAETFRASEVTPQSLRALWTRYLDMRGPGEELTAAVRAIWQAFSDGDDVTVIQHKTAPDALTPDERFHFEHGGWSYLPSAETPEQGRLRSARKMAAAEMASRAAGLSFEWEIDPDVDSSDFDDDPNPWQLWSAIAYDATGNVVASLHAIDFGRGGSPYSAPYRRIVEAELAAEALS